MNETIKIAAAAFLHDIGKLLQRIAADSGEKLPDCFPAVNYQGNKDWLRHAAWTAFFIKNGLGPLPGIDNADSFADLAAKHHLDSSSISVCELIIKTADSIASGMEKQENDRHISAACGKTRLVSIFDQLDRKVKNYESRRYQHNLSQLNPQGVFPSAKGNDYTNYSQLKKGFEQDLEKLRKACHQDLKSWFGHFRSIIEKWTVFVPADEEGLPDVSLYDHSLATSAIAQAMYAYHYENNTLEKDRITASAQKKFLYFKAKFNGIQNFIFSAGSQTNKNAAKILRGRSFYIAFIMQCLSRLICSHIGLAGTASVMAAAGSITLILPNTEKTREILKDIENKANDWLIKHFYGETSISFAYIEMSASDFVSGLDTAGTALAKKLEKAKYHKIPEKVFGIAENYFGPGDVPCPYCGKRPAHSSGAKCDICEDLARIGENIPKKIQTSLNVKIFDECCEVRSQDYDSLYVPKDDRGGIKTFDKIAESLSEKGIEALAVFKADVDNLGKLFRSAAKKGGMSRQASLSRILDSFWTLWLPDELKNNARFNNIYTVFSGGDDLFLIGKWDEIIDFSVYLRTKFLEFVCNSPCVTFSAGIALLKCGEPVQKFYEFSEDALETSKAFESGSLSKNALTLFGETISWTRLEELKECDSYIAGLIENCRINSAALQKIMEFISMADKTDEINGRIRRNEKVRYSEMSCFKWKALLSYFISRNDAIKKQEDRQNTINYFTQSIANKSTRSILKAATWKNIYKNRIRRK